MTWRRLVFLCVPKRVQGWIIRRAITRAMRRMQRESQG